METVTCPHCMTEVTVEDVPRSYNVLCPRHPAQGENTVRATDARKSWKGEDHLVYEEGGE